MLLKYDASLLMLRCRDNIQNIKVQYAHDYLPRTRSLVEFYISFNIEYSAHTVLPNQYITWYNQHINLCFVF